jgi:hypothetical protein
LTLQKNRKLVALVGLSVIAGIVLVQVFDSCQLRQLSIMSEIEQYGKSMDPQQCVILVDKIVNLNAECKTSFDIVDCG